MPGPVGLGHAATASGSYRSCQLASPSCRPVVTHCNAMGIFSARVGRPSSFAGRAAVWVGARAHRALGR
eukprot:10725662-Alexandrium_andersonii.AAC.1